MPYKLKYKRIICIKVSSIIIIISCKLFFKLNNSTSFEVSCLALEDVTMRFLKVVISVNFIFYTELRNINYILKGKKKNTNVLK